MVVKTRVRQNTGPYCTGPKNIRGWTPNPPPKRPHRTPKIRGRCPSTDGYRPITLPSPPVQPRGEINNIHPTAPDPQISKNDPNPNPRVKVVSPLGQDRLVGPYPLWDSVYGSPVHWGVWSIPSPNIFGSSAVFCWTGTTRVNYTVKDASELLITKLLSSNITN